MNMKFYLIFFTILINNSCFSQTQYEKLNYCLDLYQNSKFEEAIKCLETNIQEIEHIYGNKSPHIARNLNYLGMSYAQLSNFYKAESLFTTALNLVNFNNKLSLENYIDIICNLSNLYLEMGMYKNSKEILLKYESKVYYWSKERVLLIDRLIDVERELGNNQIIDSLFKVRSVINRTLGNQKEHEVFYSKSIEKLEKKQYLEAQYLIQEAIKSFNNIKENNGDILDNYKLNLASIYQKLNNFHEAEKLYKEILIDNKRSFKFNEKSLIILQNLASLYVEIGDWTNAIKTYDSLNTNLDYQVNKIFPFLSLRQKENYWKKIKDYSDNYYSFCMIGSKFNPILIDKMLNFRLFIKGFLLKDMANNILLKRNLENKDLYKQWSKLRETISGFYSLGFEEMESKKEEIKRIESDLKRIEIKMNVQNEKDKNFFEDEGKNWISISKQLKNSEAAIEIIRINFNKGTEREKLYYVAIIIRSNFIHPQIVIFDEGTDLEGLFFRNYQRSIKHRISNKESYHQIWEKIQPFMFGVNKIFIANDGVFYRINFETIQIENKEYLLKDLNFIYVNNLLDIKSKDIILEGGYKFVKDKRAILLGAPNFSNASNFKNFENRNNSIFKKLNEQIKDLPGTKFEIDSIYSILTDHNFNAIKYIGDMASESNLKKIISPNILHIASHGLVLEKNIINIKETVDFVKEPLLNTGILLSNNETNPKDLIDDGFLTAFEVMSLDLSNTDLVVLSACETGLGEVEISEGVYGLQRAFQIAGAKFMIMSLWKVDDYVTKDLMVNFYNILMRDNEVENAFYKAKLLIKEKYKYPYFWGAFILIKG